MLRCINGLESIDAGTIRFDGRPVHLTGREIYAIRAEIGMVQQFNLFPHMTVLENITRVCSRSDMRPRRRTPARAQAARAGRFRRRPTTIRPTSLAGSSSGSRLHERWPSSRSFGCCSTSLPRRSTRK